MVPLSLSKSILSNFDWILWWAGHFGWDVVCARCEDQLSGGRCPRLSIHHPQQCSARANPDQTGKNVRANTFCNLKQVHFKNWDKYILRFGTNTSSRLSIHRAIPPQPPTVQSTLHNRPSQTRQGRTCVQIYHQQDFSLLILGAYKKAGFFSWIYGISQNYRYAISADPLNTGDDIFCHFCLFLWKCENVWLYESCWAVFVWADLTWPYFLGIFYMSIFDFKK